MNILVTGGAGFIGSHVVDGYLEAGHRVVVLDNLSSGNRDFVAPGAVFYEADLLTADLGAIIRKEGIQVINHHAAQISVQESVKDPVFDAKSNIIGTLQLLENALSSNVTKFIFASTGGAMYGDQQALPVAESASPSPVSPYAISKLSAEYYLRYYEQTRGLGYTVLRYSNVYGPRQNPHGEAGVVAIHCNRLQSGERPVVFGDGEQTRDFISVLDLVPANLLALNPEITGVFHIGTGIETSVNHLTETLIRLHGREVSIEYQPAKPGEQRRSAIDSARMRKHGWQPRRTLEEGLFETLRYFAKAEA